MKPLLTALRSLFLFDPGVLFTHCDHSNYSIHVCWDVILLWWTKNWSRLSRHLLCWILRQGWLWLRSNCFFSHHWWKYNIWCNKHTLESRTLLQNLLYTSIVLQFYWFGSIDPFMIHSIVLQGPSIKEYSTLSHGTEPQEITSKELWQLSFSLM